MLRINGVSVSKPISACCARSARLRGVPCCAMQRADVLAAAQGCSVIVHAVNPPGYRRWAELVLPMLDNTIAAATARGATIVLPGTVYNYGPDVFPLLAETAPQQPVTRKGAIRVALEQRLQAATQLGARVLIVRAGDFFGPQAGNSWFAQGLVKPGQTAHRVSNPGCKGGSGGDAGGPGLPAAEDGQGTMWFAIETVASCCHQMGARGRLNTKSR